MSGDIRLLVVDDEKDILEVVLKHLRKNGFEASGFTDPLKALDEFKSSPARYSMVLTDMRMPGMNGVDLAEHILNVNPDIKVMVMTAFEVYARDLRVKLPVITHADIFHKPFRLVEICSRIKQLVNAS